MKKYIYSILILALPLLLISAVNDDFLGMLQEYLNKYNKQVPQEKVYVQTDKTYYKPSEGIYYKAFLVNANSNRPSTVSDVLYVELHDPWGNVLQKHQQMISGGTCNAHFMLKEDVPGGLYKLVAYTNWMKNFGEESLFSKELTVQKVITPRLLLKLDFQKRAYGAGDEVLADLKVTDLNNEKTNNSIVKSTVRIGGEAVETLENTTADGETTIRFKLPQNLSTTDGILQIVVNDRGTEESITRSIPIVLNKIAINFYPEGGDMVEGAQSKVAFEAMNEFKKGADVSGEIVDENGAIETTFESFHLGMGAFEFTPKSGKKYYARITKPTGNESLRELPVAQKKGFVLSLKSKDENKVIWNIYSSQNVTAGLVAQVQGEIHYNQPVKLKKGLNTVEVPTANFPIGIAVFTLFDGKHQEACERLVYLNAEKGLNIELNSRDVFTPGENVHLTIKTTDKNGNPVPASLGLSVVDEQLLTMADDKQDNILSYLLFSTELKGKIQEPYFYFDEKEAKAKEAIDYLMLTHGWRRFTWSEIANPSIDDFKEFPEKLTSVYGFVLDKAGNPTQAEVFVIETEGKKRVARVKTTPQGHFVFHNIDITGSVFVTTKLPNQVYLFKGKPITATPVNIEAATGDLDENTLVVNKPQPPVLSPSQAKDEEPKLDRQFISNESVATEEFAMMDFADSPQLDEVVVVGYGTQKRASLTGAVSTVSASMVSRSSREAIAPVGDLSSALAGRVAGLMITPSGGSSGISIRGMSSSAAGGEPLVVINGVAVSAENGMSFVDPNDIQSVSVLKNSSASAIYGSRAANGVILIETKKSPGFQQKMKVGESKYGGVLVPKRQFYIPPYNEIEYNNYDPDRSTVYWKGNVKTDDKGVANINFRNNEMSSTFRITAEGIGNGLIGSGIKRIVTRKPFSIDAKTPLFAAIGDEVKIPVMVRNNTDEPITANVKMRVNENLYLKDDGLIVDGTSLSKDVMVPANESKTVYFTFIVGSTTGSQNIEIFSMSGNQADNIKRSLTVRRIDFPYYYHFSGKDEGQTRTLNMSAAIPGTLRAEAVSYSDMLDQLFDGVESIFREPHGCFEQLSSSTFPNIFAMQLLKATNQDKPEVYKKAMKYLTMGYNKLAAYEVKGSGGFEWYGGSPAHEVLSAYGLVEFYEMSKVYDNVDKKMMNRALDFILSRRNGTGGFNQNNGRYGFSGAPKNVNNAYIVYALTETGYGNRINAEYQATLKEAFDSKDIYRMALLANAAYNMKDMESYERLTNNFKEIAQKEDFSKLKLQSTIVRSYGDASQREAVAFWMLALLKEGKESDLNIIEKCLEFINKGRSNGSFGGTQATSICLQALTRYAENMQTEAVGGKFCVIANGEELCKNVTKSKVVIPFSSKLKTGENTIQVRYKETDNYVPYAVTISWNSLIPATSKLCPLKLTASMALKEVKVNETVRMTVKLQNTENEGKPMSVAIIGIPGGLSLQPWQLKELQEKGIFDFYEITNDNLVVYYRELGPAEVKTISLDLKAEIPGTYRAVASSAYVYYMNEHKYWIEGLSVKIKE
ncbi:TonB-dependent receptor plug domain-containing protein [Prevotella sp. 10(H)]|uniref:TonB-dependent receptor plug domain-containing protein n=1 Tax=Prevotella sp. 10(H) TaxID=1158294 RepID=UPI0004A75442|nr:TonB-dependent receptor plug domain-containing protein [Prevotella sp. 10(H)]